MSLAEASSERCELIIESILGQSRIKRLLPPYHQRLVVKAFVEYIAMVNKETHGRYNDVRFGGGSELGEEVVELLTDFGVSKQGARACFRSTLVNAIQIEGYGFSSLSELKNFQRRRDISAGGPRGSLGIRSCFRTPIRSAK